MRPGKDKSLARVGLGSGKTADNMGSHMGRGLVSLVMRLMRLLINDSYTGFVVPGSRFWGL